MVFRFNADLSCNVYFVDIAQILIYICLKVLTDALAMRLVYVHSVLSAQAAQSPACYAKNIVSALLISCIVASYFCQKVVVIT